MDSTADDFVKADAGLIPRLSFGTLSNVGRIGNAVSAVNLVNGSSLIAFNVQESFRFRIDLEDVE